MKYIAPCTLALALAFAANLRADGPAATNPPGPAPGSIIVAPNPAPLTVRSTDPQAEANTYIKSLDKTVQFTDEQKQAITALFEKRKEALDQFAAANGQKLQAAAKAVNDAYKSQDPDAVARANETFQKLAEPQSKILHKFHDDLDKVLTSAQRNRLQDVRVRETIKLYTDPAVLTESQIKQLKDAFLNPIPGQTFEQALDAILTFEQKKLIAANQARHYVKAAFAPVTFTPEQQQQVDAIVAGVEKDPDLQDPPRMHSALYQRISAILTDEQNQAVRTGRKPRPQPAPANTKEADPSPPTR